MSSVSSVKAMGWQGDSCLVVSVCRLSVWGLTHGFINVYQVSTVWLSSDVEGPDLLTIVQTVLKFSVEILKIDCSFI